MRRAGLAARCKAATSGGGVVGNKGGTSEKGMGGGRGGTGGGGATGDGVAVAATLPRYV